MANCVPRARQKLVPSRGRTNICIVGPSVACTCVITGRTITTNINNRKIGLAFFPVMATLRIAVALPNGPDGGLRLARVELASSRRPLSNSFAYRLDN